MMGKGILYHEYGAQGIRGVCAFGPSGVESSPVQVERDWMFIVW